MHLIRYRWLVLMSIALLGGVVGCSVGRESTDRDGVPVFSPDEPIYGATLGEWSARHWQWTVSFPAQANPNHDVTGSRCGYGQSAPVFFIPRNFPPCVVPAGVALFVPVTGTECSTFESPPYYGKDEVELGACAAAEVDRYTGITVRVNGEEVPDIDTYRASSPLFTMALPENNVLGVPAGVAHAVADGYYVMLEPLPAGEHEITVHVETTDGVILPDKILLVTVISPTSAGPDATPVAHATPATGSPEATAVPRSTPVAGSPRASPVSQTTRGIGAPAATPVEP